MAGHYRPPAWLTAAGSLVGMSAVWLLDVDGVINASRPGWGGPPRRARVWSREDEASIQLRWAPGLVRRIRELHVSGHVEVRWATTWCNEAEILEELWSLPPLPRAFRATILSPS